MFKAYIRGQFIARLQELKNELKLVHAHVIEQKVLYAEQKMFEYRDKDSKQLAHALQNQQVKKVASIAKIYMGSHNRDIMEKLEIFKEYYKKLYTRENISFKKIHKFLDTLELPIISKGHGRILDNPIFPRRNNGCSKKNEINYFPWIRWIYTRIL